MALLGAAAAPEAQTASVESATTTGARVEDGASPRPTGEKKPAPDDEQQAAIDQETTLLAPNIPVPVSMLQPVQAGPAIAAEKKETVPTYASEIELNKPLESVSAGIAPSTASDPRILTETNPGAETSSVALVNSEDGVMPATEPGYAQADPLPAKLVNPLPPLVPDTHQHSDAGVKPHSSLADQPPLPGAVKDKAAQSPSAKTGAHQTLEPGKTEVAQSNAPDQPTPTEGNPDAGGETGGVQPIGGQGAVVSPVIQPGLAQAQAPDAPAQAAPINLPAILVTPLGKAASDQAAGGKRSPNPLAAKFPSSPAGPSAADRQVGKERGTRAAGPGQPKQETPANDAAKASDQPGATDHLPIKAQPAPTGFDAPQSYVPRGEVAPRSEASDPSPKPDASAQMPPHNAAAINSPLHAEKTSVPLFQSAQLVEKVSQSELRLGMRTGEFGNVEIRTSFDRQQVRAEISSERGELGRALATELPGLEQRMRERDVPLSTVVVHDATAGVGSGLDRDPRQQHPVPAPVYGTEAPAARLAAAAPQPEIWEPEGILDVRI
jgi:hypothetical protein